jgi:UDP-N-acetylmuramate--alanine ligase
MSALALYFLKGGYSIAGYDRSGSRITDSLTEEGCNISFVDNTETIPALFTENAAKEKVIVVYTPAIPADSKILTFFRSMGYRIFKRAEILGEISENTDTLAVAGTHGLLICLNSLM